MSRKPNFDVNVDGRTDERTTDGRTNGRTEIWTPISHPAISRCDKNGILPMQNKDADQLRSNCEADQHLCFRYTDSAIHLLTKSKISSLYPSSVTGQPGFYQTWSEIQIVGFVMQPLTLLTPDILSVSLLISSRISLKSV